ncbi:hypothetical protein [Clostridium beijerinckii]|uniref:Uncharacterized protein n=1 Tax=Clostridium beijerinckii TaxID=1520 RepID=A0AAW3W1B4_CLOBE|nr:hypothetical protein [Clostridium beijerinckii]MBC2455649.1 hypothetical protein [Clostridium beijerinckii]MBC2473126.1 hypothetical protein [Clostridium beijerinckii]NOV62370.1 hypothetical protein [Clostridium beijerinckii]NOV68133.1 hypothetical protein [Clostridium beijerinckii]NOW30422.1 hypothetical protein [Clostridium beijerinckii]
MSANLKEQVKSFIEKTGYPFELEVASFLHEKGWIVFSSVEYFIPPNYHKREIDIIAYKIINNRRIELRISCKKSVDKPWILFTTKNRYIKSGYMLKFTPSSLNYPKYAMIPNILKDLYFFKYNKWTINYSVFSEKRQNENRSVITDAFMSSVTSTYQWLYPQMITDNRGTIYFYIALFKGNLFESYYNSSLKTHNLSEIQYGQYETIFKLENYDNIHYSNDILKLKDIAFDRFKIEVIRWEFLDNYLNNIEKVFSNLSEEDINNFGVGWNENI